MFKFALFVVACSLSAMAAPSSQFAGRFDNQDYNINFDDTFNEITGSWGPLSYHLDVDPTFFEVQGVSGSKKVNMSFDKTFHEVSGTTPCGSINLSYDLTFKEVTGSVCGSKVNISLSNVNDVLPTFFDVSIAPITDTFPEILRSQVSRFIIYRFPMDKVLRANGLTRANVLRP